MAWCVFSLTFYLSQSRGDNTFGSIRLSIGLSSCMGILVPMQMGCIYRIVKNPRSMCVWVCETFVVHHLNGTGLHCAPPTCIVHHRPALCTVCCTPWCTRGIFVLIRWCTRYFCMFVLSSDHDGAQYDFVSPAGAFAVSLMQQSIKSHWPQRAALDRKRFFWLLPSPYINLSAACMFQKLERSQTDGRPDATKNIISFASQSIIMF